MLNVGILGMGNMGRVHARRYLHLPNARIAAVADLIPERRDVATIDVLEESTDFDPAGVAAYGEAQGLIDDANVDVIDICLPTNLHAPYAIAALEAGCHVLCEKPMALDVAAADRMIAAAQVADRRLMIAQVVRFSPEYVFLRRQIERGTYGPLRSLNMWRVGGRPHRSPDDWFMDPARSGGVALDLHIHDVDYVNAVFGVPDHIVATTSSSELAGTYDVLHACFDYADGPQIHMMAGWSSVQIPFHAGFEAWFDLAFVRYSEGTLRVFEDSRKIHARDVEVEAGDGYFMEMAYFLNCVEQGRSPETCLPSSTRDSLILIDREVESIRQFVS